MKERERLKCFLFFFLFISFVCRRMFLFVFLLPALQAILFCLAIGREPTFLKLAIVNEELDPSQGRVCNYTTECVYSMYSCRYLRHLNNETIVQVPYTNYTEALEATRRGEVWGVIHFGQNFTDEFVVRQADSKYADNETLQASQIGISLDWSSKCLPNKSARLASAKFFPLLYFVWFRSADFTCTPTACPGCLRRLWQRHPDGMPVRTGGRQHTRHGMRDNNNRHTANKQNALEDLRRKKKREQRKFLYFLYT